MTTFVVLGPADSPKLDALDAAIHLVFPDHYFEIARGQYVGVTDLNAVQVGERLGPEGRVGQFVVFEVADHYGWHRIDLWDWIRVRASA